MLLIFTNIAYSDCRGCCSHHNGVCCINHVTICCDGTSLSNTCKNKGCNKCGSSSNNNSGEDYTSETDNSSGSDYSDSDKQSEKNDSFYTNSKKVRLYGIDCPEYNQPYGIDAKTSTSNLALGKYIKIEPIDIDKYNRIVALATVAGKCINKELVTQGYAWVYEDFCKKSQCTYWLELEKAAKNAKMGLWAASNPIPPWEWRNLRQYNLRYNKEYYDAFYREYGIFFGVVTKVIDGDTLVIGSNIYDGSNLPENESDYEDENQNADGNESEGNYYVISDGDLAPLGNRDGTVDVGDAMVALRFALGIEIPSPDDILHGDIAPLDNQNRPKPDGLITVGDALIILRKALGII